VRAYERVVEQIERAIYRGDLKPGERLSSERQLMVQFAVSRSTVREALRVLQSAGLIRSRPGDPNGPLILPFSTIALEKSLASLARVEQLSLVDLLQFRMLIEGAASMLAARGHTPEHIEAMEAALTAMEAALDEGDAAFSVADLAFHEAIAGAAGNPLLRACNAVVRDVVLELVLKKISEAPDHRAQMAETLRLHRKVLDAVRSRQPARAAELSRRHLLDYYGQLVPAAERDRLWSAMEDGALPPMAS
jgi:GntR family transcriptional repressor for pyruvate dehydrogenase complex